MTTIAAKIPAARFDWRPLFVILVALFMLTLGWTAARIGAIGAKDVPLKRCATCPSCACPGTLGGIRCGCPR